MTSDSETTDSGPTHLLNCCNCDWYAVVEGPSMVADVERELHGDSIRNWRVDDDLCPLDGIAWAFLSDSAQVGT